MGGRSPLLRRSRCGQGIVLTRHCFLSSEEGWWGKRRVNWGCHDRDLTRYGPLVALTVRVLASRSPSSRQVALMAGYVELLGTTVSPVLPTRFIVSPVPTTLFCWKTFWTGLAVGVLAFTSTIFQVIHRGKCVYLCQTLVAEDE